MQSIRDSTVPAHFTFHAFKNATTWLHDGGVFCRQESAVSTSQSSETELSNAEIVLAAHRDLLPKGSVKRNAMSKSLLREGMLAWYHITAAITACIVMAIPLTRANRLAAMRESDERITSIFTPFLRGPLRFTYALVFVVPVPAMMSPLCLRVQRLIEILVAPSCILATMLSPSDFNFNTPAGAGWCGMQFG